MYIDLDRNCEDFNALHKLSKDYPNPSFHQIELDLNRTFPDDDFFTRPGML